MSRCPSCSAYPGSDHHPECAFMKKRGMSEINRLCAEVEALRPDAERYRFLCELNEKEPDKFYEFPDVCGWSKQEMDAAIDAIRDEGEK